MSNNKIGGLPTEVEANLIAQIFWLMNAWTGADLKRMRGEITLAEQAAEMSSKVLPVAQAWASMMEDFPEIEDPVQLATDIITPSLELQAILTYSRFLDQFRNA